MRSYWLDQCILQFHYGIALIRPKREWKNENIAEKDNIANVLLAINIIANILHMEMGSGGRVRRGCVADGRLCWSKNVRRESWWRCWCWQWWQSSAARAANDVTKGTRTHSTGTHSHMLALSAHTLPATNINEMNVESWLFIRSA